MTDIENVGTAEQFDAVAYLNDPAWFSSRYGLDRMKDLMARLGNPQDRLRYVHVAGTNGKGSTCAFLDSVLRAAGYKVGLYTSPYIECFEERIRVNGQNISPEDLLRLTLPVRDAAEAMQEEARLAGDPDYTQAHPTAFELMTAVAFLYFAEQGCDVVVLEVGLGGRMDATNVIPAPEVAVIVRLGLDHTEILGDTPAKVAGEKAGIIKRGCRVVSWPQEPEAMEVIEAAAKAARAKLTVPDFHALEASYIRTEDRMEVRPFEYAGLPYKTQLLGSYQTKNATVALETVRALRARGWKIPQDAVEEGILTCKWPGRFEVIGIHPLRIVDGGHNPQGAYALTESIDDVLPDIFPVFVLGILADKDHKQMVATLAPYASGFFCVTPPTPRALPAADLAAELREILPDNIPVEACGSFDEAASKACALAVENGENSVVATGSLYSVALAKAALLKQ